MVGEDSEVILVDRELLAESEAELVGEELYLVAALDKCELAGLWLGCKLPGLVGSTRGALI